MTGLISRWVHIASAVALLGGVLFARSVLKGAQELELVTRHARVFQLASAGLFVSGLYNFLMKAQALPPLYHVLFGIKFLLALHVFAVATLLGRAGVEPGKRQRQMTGMIISGALILALGAGLRYVAR